jgi:hypothetical protein
MSDATPPPLDYPRTGPHRDPQDREPFARQFLIGIGGGSLVSVILWLLGWEVLTSDRVIGYGITLICVVPVAKLVGGIVMIIGRTYKGAGAGLICSIGVGALILLGSCFAHMKY